MIASESLALLSFFGETHSGSTLQRVKSRDKYALYVAVRCIPTHAVSPADKTPKPVYR